MEAALPARAVNPIRVLVVEDSDFFRAQIRRTLAVDAEFEVVGEAADGCAAVAAAIALRPDVVTMDVEMPVMNGIDAVRQIMRLAPTRIVMLSAFTLANTTATLAALEAGAMDFITKRVLHDAVDTTAAHGLRQRLKLLAQGQPGAAARPLAALRPAGVPPTARAESYFGERALLVLGASTGGPALLGDLLSVLPAHFPCPVLVAVHLPQAFSASFAQRLNARCCLPVMEASPGAALLPGRVLVAPGGRQTRVLRVGGRLYTQVTAGADDERYRPSLDRLFGSVGSSAGAGALAVVLTGMGSDGSLGAQALAAAGGTLWAQDEASSAMFGMPAALIRTGLAAEVVSASQLARRLAQGL